MTEQRIDTGRTLVRPALLAGSALLAAVIGLSLVERTSTVARGPVAEPNADHVAPTVTIEGGVRHVIHETAPAHIIVDSIPPLASDDATLLWFQGAHVSQTTDGDFITLDGAGGVVLFDAPRLTPHRIPLALEGREPFGIVSAHDGGYWIVDAEGSVLRTNPDGRIVQITGSPFGTTSLTDDPRGGAWFVRSPRLFSFRVASTSDPLLVRMDAAGQMRESIGNIVVPNHSLLADLANAGHVAAGEHAIYYAPFIRDEVTALSLAGDTLWIVTRGLPQSTEDPHFEIGADGAQIDYAPVNLGISLGPDGLLYVLSIPGFTTSESRLDVLNPATGDLLQTTALADPLPTLAADTSGRVYVLDPFRLLTGVAPTERQTLAAFDLETLDGDRLTSEDLEGKVVLINFWASWCDPCREEMPALDGIRTEIDDPAFRFVTINEDIIESKARAFIDEFGFTFPVMLGRGAQRDRYHYYGLPFTVLIDREGRVVQQWSGFAGDGQIASIKAVIRAELDRRALGEGGGQMEHAGHESVSADR